MLRLILQRPIAVIMITGFLILVGIVGYQRLNVALLPELEVPRIYLITRFPGMAPTQVENMVTVPLEKAIAGTDGLDSITSRSERGVSIIQVSFRWNTGRESALIELRQNLNRVYVNLRPLGNGVRQTREGFT